MRVPHETVRNTAWSVWKDDSNTYDADQVQRAILLDIREELRTLNRVFACPNFLQIPRVLRSIRRNTYKPRPKGRKKK